MLLCFLFYSFCCTNISIRVLICCITASVWDLMSSMKDSVREVKRDWPSSRVKVVPAEVDDAFEWVNKLSMRLPLPFALVEWLWLFFGWFVGCGRVFVEGRKCWSVYFTITAFGGCWLSCGGLDHLDATVMLSGMAVADNRAAVRVVEASLRFDVVSRGYLTDGGSLSRNVLSSLAHSWGIEFVMNCFPLSNFAVVIMNRYFPSSCDCVVSIDELQETNVVVGHLV
jgi:hypothetical protein